jgi:hypothetical protein
MLHIIQSLEIIFGSCHFTMQIGVHLNQIIVFFSQILLPKMELNLTILEFNIIDSVEHVFAFVNINEAELLEIYLAFSIIVNSIIDISKILYRQVNSRELATGDELLETQRAIKVDIKMSESSSVVLELLLDSTMNSFKYILNMCLLLFS